MISSFSAEQGTGLKCRYASTRRPSLIMSENLSLSLGVYPNRVDKNCCGNIN